MKYFDLTYAPVYWSLRALFGVALVLLLDYKIGLTGYLKIIYYWFRLRSKIQSEDNAYDVDGPNQVKAALLSVYRSTVGDRYDFPYLKKTYPLVVVAESDDGQYLSVLNLFTTDVDSVERATLDTCAVRSEVSYTGGGIRLFADMKRYRDRNKVC